MRLSRCGYLIREGFRSITTHGFMSFASVTIIMACLIIMGSVSLLSLNIDALIKDLESQNEIVVFVDEDIADEDAAREIGKSIAAVENISSVEFVPRDEAMDNFMSRYDAALMEGIDETVFRHRFVVHLTDIALMSQTKLELESLKGVAKVNAHLDYAQSFVTIRNVVSVVSLVLIVILVFVSFFIMSNTIKLATFGRREEIAIMKMVGATDSFIRWPFVFEGLIFGIIGALIAFGLQWLLYEAIADGVTTSDTMQLIKMVPFGNIWQYVAAAFAAVGAVVGIGGSLMAIHRFLRV